MALAVHPPYRITDKTSIHAVNIGLAGYVGGCPWYGVTYLDWHLCDSGNTLPNVEVDG